MQLFALETMRDRYWHNMAGRIQRAWRNYMRYKHECARRIQRFWKNNKEGIEYAKVRDYGHQILAGRKERRRFSLLGYRRFIGDYLDCNGKSALGENDKITLEVARMLKDDFLQQNGMSEYDRFCPFYKTSSMLKNFVAFHDSALKAVATGDVTFAKIRDACGDLMFKLSQMKFEVSLLCGAALCSLAEAA